MKLLHYTGDRVGPNFGDELNCWLWPRVLPGFLDSDDTELFLGIGTIIAGWVPATPRKIVLGAGTSPEIAPSLDGSWDVLAVRGPLTARVLGLPETLAVTDPAILVRHYLHETTRPRSGPALMIHHARSKRASWGAACASAGLQHIDPHEPVEMVLDKIRGASVVLAEAMHAAIIADALRIPWLPVVLHDHINTFKWEDWCASLGMEYRPIRLHPLLTSSRKPADMLRAKLLPFVFAQKLRKALRTRAPMLSDDAVLSARTERLLSIIEKLKARRR